MQRIRFTRDTIPEREGGPGYKKGDEVELTRAQCERWRIRNAAEYVKLIEQEQKDEEPNGNTLDGSSDVGGQDSGDSGERAEPVDGSGEQRQRGRPPKHRG